MVREGDSGEISKISPIGENLFKLTEVIPIRKKSWQFRYLSTVEYRYVDLRVEVATLDPDWFFLVVEVELVAPRTNK